MENGKRIVLEAPEGISFRVQEGKDEIVIKVITESVKSVDMSSANNPYNYRNPKIPEGYRGGHYIDSFLIKNSAGENKIGKQEVFTITNLEDGSQFVWIPVGQLKSDATLDGKHFNEKFGRMQWAEYQEFSEEKYHEDVNQEFVESVKKYGGFYFASYHASKAYNGDLVFLQGMDPWVNINYYEAEALAANYAKGNKDVKSCITSGAAFDSVLRWILESGVKTLDEVVKDSTSWGCYCKDSYSTETQTGVFRKTRVFEIYDLAGNVDEWTSEQFGTKLRVTRGADNARSGFVRPAAVREEFLPISGLGTTSFRAVLYLK